MKTEEDPRRLLAERIAGSRYVGRSARLRNLLLYLSGRVLEGEAEEIHEQEVGHAVFGRPANYDTSADNIVRVHASVLRKRLEQYFAAEGSGEPLILEIPKGNYAPAFRQREESTLPAVMPPPPPSSVRQDRRVWVLAAVATLFASSTAYLLLRKDAGAQGPVVREFWSQIFRPGQPTDIVLDDASLGLYQDLSGRTLSLSEYFARDYLHTLTETGGGKLDAQTSHSIILKRYSSYAYANLLWKLFHVAGAGQQAGVHFARDYTFRALKANNAVLLGNSRSNPWIEPFESHLGVRWAYDSEMGIQYPVDTWSNSADKNVYRPTETGDAREGYCLIALLPNLGGNGSVLIISGTGGATIQATTDFLTDEQFVAQLRKRLPAAKDGRFPPFEALLRVKGRSPRAQDTAVVVCRPPKG